MYPCLEGRQLGKFMSFVTNDAPVLCILTKNSLTEVDLVLCVFPGMRSIGIVFQITKLKFPYRRIVSLLMLVPSLVLSLKKFMYASTFEIVVSPSMKGGHPTYQ